MNKYEERLLKYIINKEPLGNYIYLDKNELQKNKFSRQKTYYAIQNLEKYGYIKIIYLDPQMDFVRAACISVLKDGLEYFKKNNNCQKVISFLKWVISLIVNL